MPTEMSVMPALRRGYLAVPVIMFDRLRLDQPSFSGFLVAESTDDRQARAWSPSSRPHQS